MLNEKWIETNSIGPIEYYLNNGYKDVLLTKAKIIPPFSDDPILHIVKNDWLHLADHDRKIYYYNDNKDCTSVGFEYEGYDYTSDITTITYYPTLYFCNYYKYENEEPDEYDEDEEPIEIHPFILFIKKLKWSETQSEGCGGIYFDNMHPEKEHFEIYLAKNLDDITNYAILPEEKENMFTL